MTTHDVIFRAIQEVPCIDPHCHLNPAQPCAAGIADIVLYHHVWVELVSSGMDPFATSTQGLPHEIVDPGIPGEERVRRSLAFLPNIASTTVGMLLRWILRDLYGLDPDLREGNLEVAIQAIEHASQNPDRTRNLFDQFGIERAITAEGAGAPGHPLLLAGREGIPVNLHDGKRTPLQVLESYDHNYGREIRSANDYAAFVTGWVERQTRSEPRFVGGQLSAYINHENTSSDAIDHIIERIRTGQEISDNEIGSICYFGMMRLLDALGDTHTRIIQGIVGGIALPPHRWITHWSDRYVVSMARLAGAYPDIHFNLSSGSDVFTQDLGILAKHLPNISLAGTWLHEHYPYYIRKSIETRIDMVPMNKIIAFFSDAYHVEWIYPKLAMVKRLWADVLTERVEKGWMDTETALRLVQFVFYENPKRIYKV